MAYEVLGEMIEKGKLSVDYDKAVANYIKAAGLGLVKVMTKIGISTLHSYRGAPSSKSSALKKISSIATSLTQPLVSKVQVSTKFIKILLNVISRLSQMKILPVRSVNVGGDYQWRRNGERHMFNPHTVSDFNCRCDNLPQSYGNTLR